MAALAGLRDLDDLSLRILDLEHRFSVLLDRFLNEFLGFYGNPHCVRYCSFYLSFLG